MNGRRSNPKPTPTRVLLPHEVLDALAHSSTLGFDSIVLGHYGNDTRIGFWQHLSELEPWKNHPVIFKERGRWEKLVGCCIHGDGAQMYKEDEFFVWSWSSVFGASGGIKDVLLYKWPICIIPERQMRKASAPNLHYLKMFAPHRY